MREYEIIDITESSYGEINDMFSHIKNFITPGCRIYVQKFFDGDIIVSTLNLHTLECSMNQHVISIDKIIDNLVACNEDTTPYIYE